MCFGNQRLDITNSIGSNYCCVAPVLLIDPTGAVVDELENDYPHNTRSINSKMFRRWLQGSGKTPVSWQTLVDTLRVVHLDQLACSIEGSLV